MKFFSQILLLCLFSQSIIFSQGIEESLKRQALQHMQSGRFGEAIDLLNKYVSQNAQNAEGFNLRGLCYEKRTEYHNAVFDFRRAYKLDPGNPEIVKNLERTLEVWHKILYKRIEGFKREIAIDPNYPFNYLEIGKSYRWLEEWILAEQWYDEYLARDDNASPDEIIRFTIILTKNGHIQKGEKILKKYVERYPEDWRLWSRYGYFTLWLGKKGIAREAFTNALNFKPFFKEAQDGLDLANDEGYVTLYDEDLDDVERKERERRRSQEYPIDRYYRILQNDPENDDARFSLIEQLILNERYQEAYDQIQFLTVEYEDTPNYKNLWEKITSYRAREFETKVEELHFLLKTDPDNRDAVMALAEIYSSREEYTSAAEILRDYLNSHPDDTDARFFLAQILSYDRRFDSSYEEVMIAVDERPDEPKYRLLAGQLGTWLQKDAENARINLEIYHEAYPNDINALITLGMLSFQIEDYSAADNYVQLAAEIDPNNYDLQQLQSLIELKKLRDQEDFELEQLEYGRELAQNEQYSEAIPYYENFIGLHPGGYPELEAELADIYQREERYYDALELYDNLLSNEYNFEFAKRRADVLLITGDTLQAFEEYNRLAEEDPDDPSVQLALGDLNFEQGNYVEARRIYESLLDIAPDSYMINERLGWLPEEASEPSAFQRNILNHMFSYMVVSPMGYYFRDNLDFELMYGGTSLEVGFLKFLSIGGTWYRGSITNEFDRIHFTTLKGSLFFRLAKLTVFTLTYGKMYTPGLIDQPIWEGSLVYERLDTFRVAAQYQRNDASVILYSPNLLYNRLVAHLAQIDGYYYFNYGLYMKAVYQLIFTDETSLVPGNVGNNFLFRVGRKFYPDFIAGYEFNHIDFKYQLDLYYSPDRFSSHSLWGEWHVYEDKEWDIKIGGKIGYVPSNDFIVSDINFRILYTVVDNLRFSAQGFYGNTVRDNYGYSSGSIYFNAYWTLY